MFIWTCPASKVKKTKTRANYSAAATQLVLCLRLALLKGESWLRAATLDDSKTPTPVLHSTSVVVWNLYCVRVIIVRLNKRSNPLEVLYIINADTETYLKYQK